MPSPSELARQEEWARKMDPNPTTIEPLTDGGRFGPNFAPEKVCLKPDTEDLGQPGSLTVHAGALDELFEAAKNVPALGEPTGSWDTHDLLEHHQALTTAAQALMKAKNHDYAGRSGLSPFANFETSESLGVVSTEQGIMVRLLDKVKRICTFLEAGEFKVEDEKLDDTVLDLINYTVILSGYLRQKAAKA